ncbi:MAG: 4-alpha-glucanotransferase [Cytophagaceae bacterium]
MIHEKKAFILNENMAGELDNLYGLFSELNLAQGKDPDKEKMRFAIGEFLIQCPVYRFYDNQFPLDQQEAAAIRKILTRIRNQRKELSKTADLLEDILIINPQNGDKDFNQRALQFYQRLMQFSGPLMAKGVEDTLMYTYNRYLGNNEVGDSPETFGISPEEFHRKMQDRQSNHPYSINATATHDTKRGEDANARLNVLTDLADEWIKKVKTWKALNKKSKGKNGPDDNDEYFIYQALTGAYPIYSEEEKDFPERFKQYLIKALREGKKNSNWTSPNEAYEKATAEFALKLIDKKTPFWKTFLPFQQKIADFGIINSLSKVLLKFTCPGIPDVYQGTEFWDLSMVDPDNRRPVNFEKRQKLLKELERAASKGGDFLSDLWESRHDAGIKLWMIQTLLKERKESQALFTEGSYIPLVLKGKYKDHILAFARRLKNEWRIIAIPLHPAIICKQQKKDIQHLDWKDTRIELPGEAPEEWESTFSITKGKGAIYIGEVFNKLPFAYLKLNQSTGDRRAGILMHITSLPSPYGIGDLGSEAKKFADFLSRSRQSYWQLLPMNPTESGMGHSPYSSISSMAGNTLLISPEELVKDGLLDPEEIKKHQISSKETVNFTEAEKIKQVLLDKAYTKFSNGSSGELKLEFEEFCQNEAFWLNDFALYVVLKNEQKNKAWFQWPEKYKYRDKKALQQFEENYREPIRKIKWLQFIFSYQWKSLRKYCNNCGVELFGDLPFYVSYDSADVWANPDIFSLDKNGKALGIAGVPPDYFNADGQLWGMPVFRWDVLKKRKYDWWIQRLKKNMELYDILRLDHFRAFADYWEVPAGETTAKNGVWKLGPGIDFFNAIKKALGDLPFIAEDLGDINEGVHKLRDDLRLPGMKVLQFAFGDDLPGSIYIPHNYTANYVAYTGTHDNNTTRGWYRQDAGQTEKKNLEKYSGMAVKENNVHLVLARMAMASVAQTAILPLQDVLGLDEKSRMNMPASVEKNWFWRLLPGQLTKMHEELLREWTKMYNR